MAARAQQHGGVRFCALAVMAKGVGRAEGEKHQHAEALGNEENPSCVFAGNPTWLCLEKPVLFLLFDFITTLALLAVSIWDLLLALFFTISLPETAGTSGPAEENASAGH
jgi:hypothetical protein